ncbi:hypothetical protein ACCO45_006314 [Purpureocillium lilacinum]|uniref:Uncharacterized protein n=1 Tax=Purpureocillium lilacinum TaxID=33203 RepID=A0ACC4DPZ1_PURLI
MQVSASHPAAEGVQKRNRQTLSCIACRRRKTKCDRRLPCGACERRGVAVECRFSGAPGLEHRLKALEDMVRSLAEEDRPTRLAPVGEPASSNGPRPGNRLQYQGATSWAAVVESIRDIRDVVRGGDDDGGLSVEAQGLSPEIDPALGVVAPVTMRDVTDSLPSREDSDRLVSAYFNAKFLAVPFIHTHQFRREYEAFWRVPASASLLWTSILFAVLSAGATVLGFAAGNDVSNRHGPKELLATSARCLVAGRYLDAKPLSVEAVLTYAHCRDVQTRDADSTLWALYGLAARLAQKMGYHRDPAKVFPDMSPFAAEMRRRVWFAVQAPDLLFSFQHGMSPIVHDGHALPLPRPPTDPTPILAYRLKSTLCEVLRRVMRHVNRLDAPLPSDTMRLHAELQAWWDSIPPCLRNRPIRSTAFTDPYYTIMHRVMLELLYLKALCVLHRPYMSRGHGDEHAQSRRVCREAALRVMELHADLDQEMASGGRMHQERFMVSSLLLHHFLVAAMVICLDLSESTDLSAHDRHRRVGALRNALRIWSIRDGDSSDARHACKVLCAILNREEAGGHAGSSLGAQTLNKPSTGQGALDQDPADLATNDIDLATLEVPSLNRFFTPVEAFDWPAFDQFVLLRNSLDEPPAWTQLE